MTAGGSRGFDARVAHPARVYDYWLGGKDNFEADRIAGEAAIAAYPAIRASARANRASPRIEDGGPTSLWGGVARKP
jgi:S-adenosyl methyltransferase